MKELLESKTVFYLMIFLSFVNIIADISSHDFMFVFLFLVIVFSLDPFFENKTILLFLALITSNVFLIKFKYNRLKYYYLYMAKQPNKPPSYVIEGFTGKKSDNNATSAATSAATSTK
jgi:hypothetical protein